ncbi:hypothetical protein [Larkinella sp.]|uniref:hypothetical protein n=1 Tax=Larkinella sp. TaxID=2034517 RepID=UPI003BAA2D81
MNQVTQTRKWPTLKLSRWQIIQLSVLSLLITAMSFWRFQYEQVLPRINPVQMMMMQEHGDLNGQTFVKNTLPQTPVSKVQL